MSLLNFPSDRPIDLACPHEVAVDAVPRPRLLELVEVAAVRVVACRRREQRLRLFVLGADDVADDHAVV